MNEDEWAQLLHALVTDGIHFKPSESARMVAFQLAELERRVPPDLPRWVQERNEREAALQNEVNVLTATTRVLVSLLAEKGLCVADTLTRRVDEALRDLTAIDGPPVPPQGPYR